MTLWESFLHKKLSRLLKIGALEVTYADGTSSRYGDAAAKPVRARLRNSNWTRRLVLDPELVLGEAYMEGGLEIEGNDIYALLDLIWINILSKNKPSSSIHTLVRRAARRIAQFNPARRAQKNAAHHYNVGNDLYRLFLDEDLQYSCAYFAEPGYTLEQAQAAKKRLIAKKLAIEPNQSVLDIGCGWGGLGIYLAETTGARVDGVTLAKEQLSLARMRASARELSKPVNFRLQDYRALNERYDRIVSVGMFEHVGVPHYQEYFDQIARLMNEDGVALIHTIGRTSEPGVTNPWIAKYIFPGGYIPALSEILPAIERAGLVLTDVEVLRLHYAETLKEWRRRFLANTQRIAQKYDDRFIRMWDFYLAVSELSFRYGEHVVFQIQLAKQQDAVPLTRSYLTADTSDQCRHDDKTRICA